METPNDQLAEGLELDIAKSVAVIKNTNKATASHLQGSLKLGYGRAVQVLNRLEEMGIVGPAQGRKPREIFTEKLNAFLISSALPSAPEVASITPPAADGNVSQDRPLEIPSADAPLSATVAQLAEHRASNANVSGSSPDCRSNFDQSGVDGDTLTSNTPEGNPSMGPDSSHATIRTRENSVEPVQFWPLVESNLKLAVIAYLPPERFNTLAFLENLKRNPSAHELITFSDTPEFGDFKPTVQMKRSIEIPALKEKMHGIANLAFYIAFGEAWKRGVTHFIYLEADCRVRTNKEKHISLTWDQVLHFDFAFAQSNQCEPLIVAGHAMLDNPFGSDPETSKRAKELLAKWNPNFPHGDPVARNKPIACRKQRGSVVSRSMVGCNGAGAIYSVEGLRMLFPEISGPADHAAMVGLAQEFLPFDWEIGHRIWQKYKSGAFDHVAHLPSIFSSYGNTLTSEAERLAMLRSGTVVLCHQVKSEVVE